MSRDTRVTRKALYKPHAEFLHAAWVHLEHVREQVDGHWYSLLASFMASAFAFEAYLNYVGPKVEPSWEDFEYCRLGARLRHIGSVVGVEIADDRPPFQTIAQLFTFRNHLAHPRPSPVVRVSDEHIDHYQKALYSEPRPDYFDFATLRQAERCFKDVKAAIILINGNLPDPEDDPLRKEGWTGEAKCTPKDT